MAAAISGTCVVAHDTAAIWLMSILTTSPFLLSLMSTVAALSFFLFTLPAGALADRVDRRALVCFTNLFTASIALALALLGWAGLLNPQLILVCVFFIGVGLSLNAPAWTSIVRQVVSDAELPSAATLGSLQLSISGIAGPALGGLLVPLAGANSVFAANAACFLLVIAAILQWQPPRRPAKPLTEGFLESLRTVVRYARNTRKFQVVLARNSLFALFVSVIPALMPIVGLHVLQLSSSHLGLLFASLGTGSVLGATLILPALRTRLSPDGLTLVANLLLVVVYLLMASVRRAEILFFVAGLAGIGWTISACELWLATQRMMPDWARGRMNATVIMISQGALGMGGLISGFAGATVGPRCTLLGAAVLFLATLIMVRRLSINFVGDPDEQVAGGSSSHVELEGTLIGHPKGLLRG